MILWVRHGQSTWNVIDRMQGHELSPPLTELGREQAAGAAEALTGQGVVRILSSPAVRATETAEIIAERLGLDVVVEPLLLEKGLEEDTVNVLVRIRELLEADHPEHTVAVSHGDTIGLAVGLLRGRRPELPGNCSITGVDLETREVEVAVPGH
jgi:broad specificity phosphatase PhoE